MLFSPSPCETLFITAASIALLVGCTHETVVVPPQALPALAEREVIQYQRLSDGRRVVEQGPIRWVGVRFQPTARREEDAVEWFRAPFAVRLSADQLHLADELRAAGFPLRDVRQIDVRYEASAVSPGKGMMISGIVLTSIGAAWLVAGAGLMGVLRNSPGLLVAGLPVMLASIVPAGVGIPLWIDGARRAGPDGPPVPMAVPSLVPARNGAALRWAF